MKKNLLIAAASAAVFFIFLSSCTKNAATDKAGESVKLQSDSAEVVSQSLFKTNETILNVISDNELLNKIYLQTDFYYCAETNQLMLIKIDSTNKGIINENFQEEKLNLYTIIYALNADGKLMQKESACTPIESIKSFKSVYEKLQKSFEFSENGAMTYIDSHGKRFEKYNVGIADDEQLYSELKKLFQNRFDLYLGSYHSDKYNKDYRLVKDGNKYTLEVQDENNNVVKDFYEFDTKASLLGTEGKYYISIDKERDSFQITEYVDYSLYPDFDEMTNSDEYEDIIKQEAVTFKLSDRR